MTINANRKRCGKCEKPMRRWGKTPAGRQRWQCVPCDRTGTRARRDVTNKSRKSLFLTWVRGKAAVADVAKRGGGYRTDPVSVVRPVLDEPAAGKVVGTFPRAGRGRRVHREARSSRAAGGESGNLRAGRLVVRGLRKF